MTFTWSAEEKNICTTDTNITYQFSLTVVYAAVASYVESEIY
jgi:hypothetical protein